MGRGKLSKEEIDILRKNPYVSDVSETRIIYTNEFKFLYMEEYLSGKPPSQIFRDAGFDTKILGSKRIERASHRWKESYAAGSLGMYEDGSIRKQKPHLEENEYLEILKKLQAEIEELKAENERLRQRI